MPLVDAAHANGVTTLTIDSPGNRNALSAPLLAELRSALSAELPAERTHVLKLTASGRTFCAGADLSEIRAEGTWASAGALGDVLELLAGTAKPTVARVNGHVRGGGMGLVGACDVAVAPAAASFAFPEVRLGVAPAMIAPVVVPRLEPRAASRYLLSGQSFDAAEATRIGLLTASADDLEGVDAFVDELVAALLEGDPAAQAATKRVLRDTGRRLPAEQLSAMRALSEELFSSAEAQRRIAAILDR